MKLNTFDKEQNNTGKKKKNAPFHGDHLYYNPRGRPLRVLDGSANGQLSEGVRETKSGYKQRVSRNQAKNCRGSPLSGVSFKGKKNRTVARNHELEHYKQQARENLLSETLAIKRKINGLQMWSRSSLKLNPTGILSGLTFGALKKVGLEFELNPLAHNIRKKCA